MRNFILKYIIITSIFTAHAVAAGAGGQHEYPKLTAAVGTAGAEIAANRCPGICNKLNKTWNGGWNCPDNCVCDCWTPPGNYSIACPVIKWERFTLHAKCFSQGKTIDLTLPNAHQCETISVCGGKNQKSSLKCGSCS